MTAQAQTQLSDFQNIFSLEGKVAVVTGGSRGLGLHAASGYLTPSLNPSPHAPPSKLPVSQSKPIPQPTPHPPFHFPLIPPLPSPSPKRKLTPPTPSFLQAGCSKVYITSRKASACDEACAALNALPNKRAGATAIAVPADSAKFAEIEKLVAEVGKSTEHVDILFANAGATWGEKFDTHPDSAFAKVMDLNVKSVFNTIRL